MNVKNELNHSVGDIYIYIYIYPVFVCMLLVTHCFLGPIVLSFLSLIHLFLQLFYYFLLLFAS